MRLWRCWFLFVCVFKLVCLWIFLWFFLVLVWKWNCLFIAFRLHLLAVNFSEKSTSVCVFLRVRVHVDPNWGHSAIVDDVHRRASTILNLQWQWIACIFFGFFQTILNSIDPRVTRAKHKRFFFVWHMSFFEKHFGLCQHNRQKTWNGRTIDVFLCLASIHKAYAFYVRLRSSSSQWSTVQFVCLQVHALLFCILNSYRTENEEQYVSKNKHFLDNGSRNQIFFSFNE